MIIKQLGKKLFLNKKIARYMCLIFNFINYKNRLRVNKKNRVISGAFLAQKLTINIRGVNNRIIISDGCRFVNSNIQIAGNNNIINIGEKSYFKDVEFWIEDDNNEISIGDFTSIHGRTQLAAIESTKILIGQDCMFSNDIYFRTGDSHSIIDKNGKRINPSQNIIIGNHVWIGTKNLILKGTEVADNCIVGANSTLSKKYINPNSIIVGSPAKIIKNDINWKRERI